MEYIFITDLAIEKIRHLNNLSISLDRSERKHLILTGKNGAGKSTVLESINKFLTHIQNGNYQSYDSFKETLNFHQKQLDLATKSENTSQIASSTNNIRNVKNWFDQFGGIEINFNITPPEVFNASIDNKFLIAYFDAKRQTNARQPQGIQKINWQSIYSPNDRLNSEFIQFIVNMKADRSFARDEGDTDSVAKIDLWFENFIKQLRLIFQDDSLNLEFDRLNYTFNITQNSREPMKLNNLSDGFSAILSILTELILRVEITGSKNYNLSGIVIIDEIETHLHVELQKQILPFLISFFPNVQFIVSTHSPFVLSSIQNAIIWDLEKNILTSDLSSYSYEALIESYFKVDQYSETLKKHLLKYEKLLSKEILNDLDKEELNFLEKYLNSAPSIFNDELYVRLQQLKISKID